MVSGKPINAKKQWKSFGLKIDKNRQFVCSGNAIEVLFFFRFFQF